jgi:hypothetical protein
MRTGIVLGSLIGLADKNASRMFNMEGHQDLEDPIADL